MTAIVTALITLMGDGKGDWGGGKITLDPCGMVAAVVVLTLVVMAARSRVRASQR